MAGAHLPVVVGWSELVSGEEVKHTLQPQLTSRSPLGLSVHCGPPLQLEVGFLVSPSAQNQPQDTCVVCFH